MPSNSLTPAIEPPITLHTSGNGASAYSPAPEPQKPGDEVDLRNGLRVIQRNWHLILGCFVLALATGWFMTSRIDPVYQAQATLRIDDEGELPSLEILKTLGREGKSEVATEMEVLRSRALAREVVDALGLQVGVSQPARVPRSRFIAAVRMTDSVRTGTYVLTREASGRFSASEQETKAAPRTVTPGGVLRVPGGEITLAQSAANYDHFTVDVKRSEKAIDDLFDGLMISRPNRDAAIVAVKYRGTDPEVVRDVPNVLVKTFVQRRVQVKKTGATSTVAFLREQLDTISHQLRRSEDSLKAFRESNQIVSLQTEADAQVQNLASLQAQRNQVDAERSALETLVRQVQAAPPQRGQPSPYRKLLAFPTLFSNPAVSQLLSTLNTLEQHRGELLESLRPPDVYFLDRMIAEAEAQVRGMVLTYLSGLQEQVASLDRTLTAFGKRLEVIPAREVRYARLQRNTQVLSDIHTMLQTKLKESEIVQAVEDPSVRAVDLAHLPEQPVSPRKSLYLVLGGMLGIMLGSAAAFGREWMDTAIHSREDMQRVTGLPVLGLIPHIKDASLPKYRLRLRNRRPERATIATARALSLVAGREPQSMIAEAYRTLRTNLAFARPDRPPKVIVFTSPSPGDGKTTSVANLAATLAQQDLRVLVIDADLRRGYLHRVFQVHRHPGLSEVLVGMADVMEVLQEVELQPQAKLHFVATGVLPPNPAELLASASFRQMLDRLDPLFDVILIDSPPVNVFTDAAVMGTQVDGALLVSRAGKSQKAELKLAMEQLRNVRVQVLGAVLNDFNLLRDARYGGAYEYYSPGYSYSGRTEDV